MPASDTRRELASILRGVMLSAAHKRSMTFVNWSQYTLGHTQLFDRYIGGGLCQGLSMVYLATRKNGQQFEQVVDRTSLSPTAQYEQSDLQEAVQNAAFAGNIGGNDRDVMAEHLVSTWGFRMIKHETFRPHVIGSARGRFASFVTHAGYYMVSVPGHALAATAVGGRYDFFDPNCGIARTGSASTMRGFISDYFGHSFVKEKYGHGSHFKLQATRFK